MSNSPEERAEFGELPEREMPPGRHQLLKEHLMTEMNREQRNTGMAPVNSPTKRRKWLRPALSAAALATAAAVAFTTFQPSDDGTQSPPAAASEEAVELLENIALAAEGQRMPDGIEDDQFVYIRSKATWMEYNPPGGNPKLEPPHNREVWLSVDGTQEGLLHNDGSRGGETKLEPDTPGRETNTNYRSLQKLPTDPTKMLKWLYKASKEGGKSADQNAFVLVGDLSREALMPPDTAAALFRAAAQISGVVVERDVTDAAGRKGIAVAREDEGERKELIFDKRTKEFLGARTILVEDNENLGLDEGTVMGHSAILDRQVVDKVSQRP